MQAGVVQKKQRREGKVENSHSYNSEEDAKSSYPTMRLDD